MKTIIRKMAIGLVGGTVVLLGVVMIVTPGPAIVVIPAGLAILATEFVWAERWLQHAKNWVEKAKTKHREKKAARAAAKATC